MEISRTQIFGRYFGEYLEDPVIKSLAIKMRNNTMKPVKKKVEVKTHTKKLEESPGWITFKCSPVDTDLGWDFRQVNLKTKRHRWVPTSLADDSYPTYKPIKSFDEKNEYYAQF